MFRKYNPSKPARYSFAVTEWIFASLHSSICSICWKYCWWHWILWCEGNIHQRKVACDQIISSCRSYRVQHNNWSPLYNILPHTVVHIISIFNWREHPPDISSCQSYRAQHNNWSPLYNILPHKVVHIISISQWDWLLIASGFPKNFTVTECVS